MHPQLVNCCFYIPAAKVKYWRSCLCHAFLLQVDSFPVITIEDVVAAFVSLCQSKQISCLLAFAFKSLIFLFEISLPLLHYNQFVTDDQLLLESQNL